MKKWLDNKDYKKASRTEKGERFSVVDAHLERLELREQHPEHPTLTAFALSILYPKEVINDI